MSAATGTITTVAGGTATAAQLAVPYDVALDSSANLFIADRYNHRVRRVESAGGVITTVAGNGTSGFSGDGGLAPLAQLSFSPGRGR